MIYLFDKDEKLIKIVRKPAVKTALQKYALTTERYVSDRLTAELKGLNADELERVEYMAIQTMEDAHIFHFFYVAQKSSDELTALIGVQSGIEELRKSPVYDKRPQNAFARDVITDLLAGTNWQARFVGETTAHSTNFYYTSVFDALKKVCEVWDLEMQFFVEMNGNRIGARYIDFKQRIGEAVGKRVVYGHNALQILQEVERTNIYTALVGRGKGEESGDGYGRKITFEDVVWSRTQGKPVDKPKGQKYLELPLMTMEYGIKNADGSMRPKIGFVDFSEEENPEVLIERTYKALVDAARPKLTLKTSSVYLKGVKVGDTIRVVRHDKKLDYDTRIFEITFNRLNNQSSDIKLGDRIGESNEAKAQTIADKAIEQFVNNEFSNFVQNLPDYLPSADGFNNNWYGTEDPTVQYPGKVLINDIWYKPDPEHEGHKIMFRWTGEVWEEILRTYDSEALRDRIAEEIARVSQSMQAQSEEHDRQVADILTNAQSIEELANQAKTDAANAITQALQSKDEAIADARAQVATVSQALSTAKTDLQNQVNAADAKAVKAQADVNELKVKADTIKNDLDTAKTNLQNQVSDANSKAVQAQADADTLRVDLNQQAQTILAQAQAQTALTNRVTTVETLADGTRSTVAELSKTVDKTTGDLTSVTNRTKVVEDGLAGVKTNYTQLNQTVNTQTGQIQTINSKTADLQSGIDGVTERFENLRIGATNYIRDFGFANNPNFNSLTSLWKYERIADSTARSGYHIKATCTQSGSNGFHRYLIDLRGAEWQGRTMTYSIDIKASKSVRMSLGVEAFDKGYKAFDVTTDWKRFISTDTVNFKTYYSFPFYTESVQWQVGDVIYIRDPQLEDGSIATTAHASEEDLRSEIAEYKRTADQNYAGLQSTVGTLDGKVTQNKTEVNQTTTQLSNRLTSVESYKDGESTRSQAYFEASKTETARQITAERTAISANYVAKSVYDEDARGTTLKLNEIKTTADTAKQNLATYQETVNHKLTELTTSDQTLDGKITAASTKVDTVAGQIRTEISNVEGKIPTFVGGRNLLVAIYAKVGYVLVGNTSITYDTRLRVNEYISVEPNTDYSLSGNAYEIWRINWFTADKVYISGMSFDTRGSVKTKTVTSPNNAQLATVSYPNGTRVKFEKGSVITDWSPAPEDLIDEISAVKTTLTQTASGVEQLTTSLATTDGKVTTAETKINQLIGDVSSKVSQTDFNVEKTKITNLQTSVTQQSDQIALKANQTELNNLTGRMSTAEGKITTQAGQIELKANKSEFDTLTGRVSTAESKITATDGKVTTLTTKTDGHTTSIGNLQTSYSGLNSTVTQIQNNTAELINQFKDPLFKTVQHSAWDGTGWTTNSDAYGRTWTNNTGMRNRFYFFSSTTVQLKVGKEYQIKAYLNTDKNADIEVGTSGGDNLTLKVTTQPTWFMGTIKATTYQGFCFWIPNGVTIRIQELYVYESSTGLTVQAFTALEQNLSGFKTTVQNTYADKTTVNQLADKIELKASTTDVNNLTGRMSTAESSITQNATEISKRLTSTQVEQAITDKGYATVTVLNNKVKETADSFSRTISETKALIPTEVGATNYIRDFGFANNPNFDSLTSLWKYERIADSTARSGYHIKATCTQSGSNGFHRYLIDLRGAEWQGRTMTYSIDIKASKSVRMSLGVEAFDKGYKAFDVTTDWKRFISTDTVNFKTYYSFPFYTESVQWQVGDVIYIRDPQLEDGTVATTPRAAEEDLATVTALHNVSDTVDSHTRTIGAVGTSGSILDNVSKVTQTANGLVTEVSGSNGLKTQVSTLAGSYAIKNLTNSGTVLNQLNLNKDGSIKIDGKLIQITGTTYIEDGVISSAKIGSLDAGKITTGTLNAARIATNSITGSHISFDQAFFNNFMANEAYLKQIFAKNAFITSVQSVAISASNVTAGVLKATNGALSIDLNNADIEFNSDAKIRFSSSENSIGRTVANLPKQYLRFETGDFLRSSQTYPASKLVIGSNSQGVEDSESEFFSGQRWWQTQGNLSMGELVADQVLIYSTGADRGPLVFNTGGSVKNFHPATGANWDIGTTQAKFRYMYIYDIYLQNGVRLGQALKDLANRVGKTDGWAANIS